MKSCASRGSQRRRTTARLVEDALDDELRAESLPASSRFIVAAVARMSPQQAAAIWSPDLAVARR
jgi:hypothetical protein